jgi:hypothetical protein
MYSKFDGKLHNGALVNLIFFLAAVFFSLSIQVLFIHDELLSLESLFIAFLFLMVSIIYASSRRLVGVLFIFYVVIYLLPFNHLAGYFIYGFDDIRSTWTQNKKIIEHINDPHLVNLVVSIAVSAMIGIFAAIHSSFFLIKKKESSKPITKSLSLAQYIFLLTLATTLAWASMPADSILDVAYTQSTARLSWFNFPSAWLVSYLVILLLYSDCVSSNTKNTKVKWLFLMLVLFYLVVVNDLGNGKRTSLPLVMALFMHHIFYRYLHQRLHTWRILLLFALATSILFIGKLHGELRHELVNIESLNELYNVYINMSERGLLGANLFLKGTWTDVLLTPFSVAYTYLENRDLLLGVDYMNMIKSIPPSFISESIGYVKPWNSYQGPAWEMVFGNGGVHATVLPFRNFGLIGVILFSYAYSLFIIYIERLRYNSNLFQYSFFFTAIAMVLPHWLWYGEKIFINTLIVLYFLMSLYKLMLSFSRRRQNSNPNV